MKKIYLLITLLFLPSLNALAQVNIYINSGYYSGYYNPSSYYGYSLGWGLGGLYSSIPYFGYYPFSHYQSPYRYKTVPPTNPQLYQNMTELGEEKIAAYYQNKLMQQQTQTIQEPKETNNKKDELIAPDIQVFKQDQEI